MDVVFRIKAKMRVSQVSLSQDGESEWDLQFGGTFDELERAEEAADLLKDQIIEARQRLYPLDMQ